MMSGRTTPLIPVLAALAAPAPTRAEPPLTSLRFEITIADRLAITPRAGRLVVILDPNGSREPWRLAGAVGLDSAPILGRDVDRFAPETVAVVDGTAAAFPIADLAHLPAGSYTAQAVLDSNRDLKGLDAPGNLVSEPVRVRLDPARGGTVGLRLTRQFPPESPPAETGPIRYLRLESKLLSAFHGRPIWLRAGVILPRGFDDEPDRRYPLRVHIGGYGQRYTGVRQLWAEGSAFRRVWEADDAPRMILLHLDGDGPHGDCYQVNSANNGPYGDAITTELIPLVEHRFRAIGRPHARVLDGGSTGGWVALALQVFYPDLFNGAWAACPDSVDFRSFELVNIYEDGNAYVNRHGFERPAARDPGGDVRTTMRHECRMENVLGSGGRWTMSGGQWGAWNAAFGPRGPDGRPVPLWDPETGRIDRRAAEHWKAYDLRRILEVHWATLGPRLRGKIRIAVGEADDFFLNNAVHRLDAFLSKADPPYEGTITYGPGRGHCWMGLEERAMMDQMAAAVAAGQGAGGGPESIR